MSARDPNAPISIGHPAGRGGPLARKKTTKPPTVASVIRQLAREGFTAAKGVETGHGSVEHVVFGATGVFTVAPKTWRRHVWVGSRPARVMVGRSDVTDTVRQIVHQALELERRARRGVPGLEVRALIVVTGTRLPAGPLRIGRASVVDIEQLPRALTDGDQVLDPATARLVADAVTDPSNVVAVSFGTD